MSVDKTQLLLKKCIDDKQKPKISSLLFILLTVRFTEVYFKGNVISHRTSHIKNESILSSSLLYSFCVIPDVDL